MLTADRIAGAHQSLGLQQQESAWLLVPGKGVLTEDTALEVVVVLGPSMGKGGAGQINSSLNSLPFHGLFMTPGNTCIEFIFDFVRSK